MRPGRKKGHIERAQGPIDAIATAEHGETIDLGRGTLEFIHTPGHTMGSLCVLYREPGILFTGDTILGTGSVVVSPDDGDMGAYLDSLESLLGYGPRMICPGHGPAIDDPMDRVRWLIDHRLARERQILGLLEQGIGPWTSYSRPYIRRWTVDWGTRPAARYGRI